MVHVYTLYVSILQAFTCLPPFASGYDGLSPEYVKTCLQKDSSRWEKPIFQLLERIRVLFKYKLNEERIPSVFEHITKLATLGWNWSEVSALFELSAWHGPHDSHQQVESSSGSCDVFFDWLLSIATNNNPSAIYVPLRWHQLRTLTEPFLYDPKSTRYSTLPRYLMYYGIKYGFHHGFSINLLDFMWTLQWIRMRPTWECQMVAHNDFTAGDCCPQRRRPRIVPKGLNSFALDRYYDSADTAGLFWLSGENRMRKMRRQYRAIQLERTLGRWRLILVQFYIFWTGYQAPLTNDMLLGVLQQMGFRKSLPVELLAWLQIQLQKMHANREHAKSCAEIERIADSLCPQRWKRHCL